MHIFVVKKATIIRAAVFLLLIVGAIVYTQAAIGEAAPVSVQTESLPICRVATDDEMIVALTFDTAFGEQDFTPQILDALKNEGVRATFFVMGLWANENGAALDHIVREGHEIASHSMNHERYPDMTQSEIIGDANAAAELLLTKTGYDTRVIRMPYGAFDTATIMALESEGYIPVKWSLDSKDWKGYEPDKLVDGVMSAVKSGDIILFQNNMPSTSEALAEIILALRERGYKIVTLSDLLLDSDYVVDAKGTQRYVTD